MFDPSVLEETRLDRLASTAIAFESTRLDAGLRSHAEVDETRRLQMLQSYKFLNTGPELA